MTEVSPVPDTNGTAHNGAGKDRARLLSTSEAAAPSERCGTVLCPPSLSALTAASLGMNGMLFGMLLILAAGSGGKGPAPAAPAAAAAGAGAGCGRPAVDVSRDACSGNGMLWDDAEACTCFDCWTGDTCSELLSGDQCVVHASGGTPFIFEKYWVDHPEAELVVKPSYHIGYSKTPHLPRLERAVRELHAMVGNAQTRGMHVVFGIGSTELIGAAIFALASTTPAAPDGAEPPSSAVWAASPFYNGYVRPASYYRSSLFHWQDGATPPTPSASQPVIEMVTSPNNPDGHTRAPVLPPGEFASTVMDYAYYWPHFVAIGAPVAPHNRSVALFTLSKLTGHASTRVGWALTPSAEVAAAMREYIEVNTLGVPRENQLRAAVVLEHVLASGGAILSYARELMLSRWVRLEACFGGSHTFALEARDGAARDGWFGEDDYAPSPAYAWVRQLDGGDALVSMASAGVVGRTGAVYGADASYVRLELLMREEAFDKMLDKVCRLVRAR